MSSYQTAMVRASRDLTFVPLINLIYLSPSERGSEQTRDAHTQQISIYQAG